MDDWRVRRAKLLRQRHELCVQHLRDTEERYREFMEEFDATSDTMVRERHVFEDALRCFGYAVDHIEKVIEDHSRLGPQGKPIRDISHTI